MIKVFITTNFEFDHQTFYTTNNFEFTNLILPTLKSSPNFFNKHHMQYTRRYADMWNMYTREDMRICGICILVYTRRYADMWNMYTCIHEKICGYVEMFYNDWLVSWIRSPFTTTNNFEFTNLILQTLKSLSNFFNKHHMQYTRIYADMWNMYTCIHKKICGYVEYVYLYTREDMWTCGICILVYTRRYVDTKICFTMISC